MQAGIGVFLSLILFSSYIDFYLGAKIAKANHFRERKQYLWASIVVNLTILCIFKYFDFFIDSFNFLFNKMGFNPPELMIGIILPIGISFYTFQSMSYTIDIYRKKITPVRSWISYFLFVGFFPQLIAGPIERAKRLLPQIESERHINKREVYLSLDFIMWGLLKKVFIADNIAYYVDRIFMLTQPSTLIILLGAVGFGIQIYCDFSAYSDIARGSAQLLGIRLIKNFNHPYLSRNIVQFWKRWHISLSYWIRDYIYIPLGGSRVSPPRYVVNVMITWFLCGLWHGAAWNFVAWGLYHGLLILIYRAFSQKVPNLKTWPWISILLTYTFTNLGWIFFRTNGIWEFNKYFSIEALSLSAQDGTFFTILTSLLLFYASPLYMRAIWIRIRPKLNLTPENIMEIRYCSFAIILLVIKYLSRSTQNDFIYFQF